MAQAIVELRGVGKSFRSADGSPRSVLESVDFTLREGEIVALLGASGSGKSTLLRVMAGLIEVDRGDVHYRGQPLYGPARGIGMVFQSFALFPWLTVQQNVELGLEARGMPKDERAHRAEAAIEMIGLSGFEGALPRELSGGMRQRVGIARALVIEPEVLLMDEAFSALDVMTGERLREDILDLWQSGRMPTKAMLVVSHNIEEAVMMADRVLVFASDPGRVRFQMSIRLPRPRNAESAEVRSFIDEVYALMTAGAHRPSRVPGEAAAAPLGERLPDADIARMEALLELLHAAPFNGRADLPKLAEEADLTDDELLPLTSGLALLDLASVAHGDIAITPVGLRYVNAEGGDRQTIFGAQLLARVALAGHIHHSLQQETTRRLPDTPFLKLLRENMDDEEAERVLRVAIEWGRHGDVFDYNYNTGMIALAERDEDEAT